MKNTLAKLVQVDRNKDVTKEKIIKSFNNGTETRRYEILVELLKSKAQPIGIIKNQKEIVKLLKIKEENIEYKFKYSNEKFFNKSMFVKLVNIDYSDYKYKGL